MSQSETPKNHHLQTALALSAVMLFATAGAGFGYWVGRYADLPEGQQGEPRRSQAQQGPSPSTKVGDEAMADLEAMTARMGDMQAELVRLNALGERLVEMSGLNPQEFDFEHAPPQGGPDEGSPVRDYTIKEIASELGSMVSLLKDRKRKLEILEEAIAEKDLTAHAVPKGWPVHTGYITSNYGFRVHPIKHRRIFHQGIDYAAPRGTPIYAVADGLVTFVGRKGGYGNIVEIRHVNGLVTRYAHNTKNLVSEGQRVRQGQKIATVGATGSATGPHVHFEVLKNGKHVNPARYAGNGPTPASTSG